MNRFPIQISICRCLHLQTQKASQLVVPHHNHFADMQGGNKYDARRPLRGVDCATSERCGDQMLNLALACDIPVGASSTAALRLSCVQGGRVPVDVCCVIDVSGSMNSQATLKDAVRIGFSEYYIIKFDGFLNCTTCANYAHDISLESTKT